MASSAWPPIGGTAAPRLVNRSKEPHGASQASLSRSSSLPSAVRPEEVQGFLKVPGAYAASAQFPVAVEFPLLVFGQDEMVGLVHLGSGLVAVRRCHADPPFP